MIDVVQEHLRGGRAYRRERRKVWNATLDRLSLRFTEAAWMNEDQSEIFAELAEETIYYDDDECIFMRRGGKVDYPVGNSTRLDLASGSYLFQYKRKKLSLARFAWWWWHDYDCGSPEHFPHMGGCKLIDDRERRNVDKENLVSREGEVEEAITIKELLQARQAQTFALACASEEAHWLEKRTSKAFLKFHEISQAVARCRVADYPDPVRKFVTRHPSMSLHLLFTVDLTDGTVTRRGKSKRLTQQSITVLSIRLPIANLLWYLVTGTFIGTPHYRNGNHYDTRLINLCDQPRKPSPLRNSELERGSKPMHEPEPEVSEGFKRVTRYRGAMRDLGITQTNVMIPEKDITEVRLFADKLRAEYYLSLATKSVDDPLRVILANRNGSKYPTHTQIATIGEALDKGNPLRGELRQLVEQVNATLRAEVVLAALSKEGGEEEEFIRWSSLFVANSHMAKYLYDYLTWRISSG